MHIWIDGQVRLRPNEELYTKFRAVTATIKKKILLFNGHFTLVAMITNILKWH